MVNSYLEMVDTSSVFHDTLDYNFQILKAYINNDSIFFQNMRKSAAAWERKSVLDLDTCIHLRKLSELHVDVAYRFSHSQSFCPYSQIITITRSKDTCWLDYLEFTFPQDGHAIEYLDGRKIPAGCAITREFRKYLPIEHWDSLEAKVFNAEYYGMKPYYYNLTTDGSWWQLDAYKKSHYHLPEFYSVYRHSPHNALFCEVGKYIMELSGAKKMCGGFF